MELAGKIALVTGAAHRVGRAIALALAQEGCSLGIHYHTSTEAAQECVQLVRNLGVRAEAFQADLRVSESMRDLFEAFERQYGGLDILVNSAAVLKPVGVLDATEVDWAEAMDVNLKAVFFCLQHAARRMRQGRGGVIVNISDLAGLEPWARFPLHSVSKAGVEMLTRAAALALAPEIRVNAVAPGPVLRPAGMSEDRWRRIVEETPLRRGGSPEDVGRSVVFLCQNDFITGETLVVDGGALWR